MFDMSPGAIERRNGEAELAVYHMAETSETWGAFNQFERRTLLRNRLAEIYDQEFDAYLDRTGLCPNCDKSVELIPAPSGGLFRCPCGCKRLSNGAWVMLHWTMHGGVLVPDHKTPPWSWLVCSRDVSAVIFEPGEVQEMKKIYYWVDRNGIRESDTSPVLISAKDLMEADLPSMKEIKACVMWITQHMKPTKTFRPDYDSYRMKHEVERDVGFYIPNGAFINAAGGEGYQIKPVGINAIFNMTYRSSQKRKTACGLLE